MRNLASGAEVCQSHFCRGAASAHLRPPRARTGQGKPCPYLGGAGSTATLGLMRTLRFGMSVGGFLLLGTLSLLYLFTRLGEADVRRDWGYSLHADFANSGGLNPGSAVEIAGVPVGQVIEIGLADGRARVTLMIQKEVVLQDDTIASIRTKGLLGERYLLISPGGSEQIIPPGGQIRETESPLDLPGLIAAYVAMRSKAPPAPKDATTPKK